MPHSWGLAVATYCRHDALIECVSCALAQTYPAREIVIVDASEDWESGKQAISRLISEAGFPGRFSYERASEASSASQRNQALSSSTADVAFLIDDDSLMWPTCAAEVMKIYDLDASGSVLAVGATDASGRWGPSVGESAAAPPRLPAKLPAFLNGLERKLTAGEAMFFPYDGWNNHELPTELRHVHASVARLIGGHRLTMRREVFPHFQFCAALKRYAAFEDFDLTYRLSRHGLLINAYDARLFHDKHPSARLSRRTVSSLQCLNMLFLYRINCPKNPPTSRFARYIISRLFISLVADCSRRRWMIPQTRGVLCALRHFRSMCAVSLDDLEDYYDRLQRQMIN